MQLSILPNNDFRIAGLGVERHSLALFRSGIAEFTAHKVGSSPSFRYESSSYHSLSQTLLNCWASSCMSSFPSVTSQSRRSTDWTLTGDFFAKKWVVPNREHLAVTHCTLSSIPKNARCHNGMSTTTDRRLRRARSVATNRDHDRTSSRPCSSSNSSSSSLRSRSSSNKRTIPPPSAKAPSFSLYVYS
jgi:hypothetical protein